MKLFYVGVEVWNHGEYDYYYFRCIADDTEDIERYCNQKYGSRRNTHANVLLYSEDAFLRQITMTKYHYKKKTIIII
jgi:hypothetical protein